MFSVLASVYSFLKSFGIDVNIRHPLFGLIKDYITNVLIKQKFLSVETDPITKKTLFSWGIRAETEINKHELLKFVCKVSSFFEECARLTNLSGVQKPTTQGLGEPVQGSL